MSDVGCYRGYWALRVGLRVCWAISGIEMGYAARVCYAMSGTDIGYAATRHVREKLQQVVSP
eukprot:265264-Rhodomonas_salina.2